MIIDQDPSTRAIRLEPSLRSARGYDVIKWASYRETRLATARPHRQTQARESLSRIAVGVVLPAGSLRWLADD
jgi:hypothetical protein